MGNFYPDWVWSPGKYLGLSANDDDKTLIGKMFFPSIEFPAPAEDDFQVNCFLGSILKHAGPAQALASDFFMPSPDS